MAALTYFSSIVTPSSSSLSSLSPLPSDHFHSFTQFSQKPTKQILKTLTLKPHNFTQSPLPLLFPLHLCNCASSSAFADIESEISGALEQYPDVVEGDEVQAESEESGVEETDEYDVGENNVKASDSSDADHGRLYVGKLPFSTTSSQLSEIFSRAGQIKSAEVIYDKLTDRSRGFGFVTMESINEAREAIRMFDGSEVGGRTIKVNFREVPIRGERKIMEPKIRISNQRFVDTPHKVYAGNLGWGVTAQGLGDAFADQEGFLSAKVIYERETGRSRGFGFVSFQSPEAAQSAIIAVNGVELEGRPLRLNMAADRSRSNAETATEQSEVVSAVTHETE